MTRDPFDVKRDNNTPHVELLAGIDLTGHEDEIARYNDGVKPYVLAEAHDAWPIGILKGIMPNEAGQTVRIDLLIGVNRVKAVGTIVANALVSGATGGVVETDDVGTWELPDTQPLGVNVGPTVNDGELADIFFFGGITTCREAQPVP